MNRKHTHTAKSFHNRTLSIRSTTLVHPAYTHTHTNSSLWSGTYTFADLLHKRWGEWGWLAKRMVIAWLEGLGEWRLWFNETSQRSAINQQPAPSLPPPTKNIVWLLGWLEETPSLDRFARVLYIKGVMQPSVLLFWTHSFRKLISNFRI